MATNIEKEFDDKVAQLEHRTGVFVTWMNSLNNFLLLGLTKNANGHFTYSIHGTFLALNFTDLEYNGYSILMEGSVTAQELATIESRDKFFIIFILAHNYLCEWYWQYYDNMDNIASQAYLHKKVGETFKKKKYVKIHDSLMDRIEVCSHKFSEARQILDLIKEDADRTFGAGCIFRTNPFSNDWKKRIEIRGYKGDSANPKYVFKTGIASSHIATTHLTDVVLRCFNTPMPMRAHARARAHIPEEVQVHFQIKVQARLQW